MVSDHMVWSHTCSYNVPDTGLCQMLTAAREGRVKTEIGHIMFPCSSSLAQYAQCRVVDIQIYLDLGFSDSAFTGFSFIFSSWPAVFGYYVMLTLNTLLNIKVGTGEERVRQNEC